MNKKTIAALLEQKDSLLSGKIAPRRVWKVTRRPDGTVKRELLDPEAYRRGRAKIAAKEAKEALALTVRRKLGVSQDRFAEILGISAGTLRNWEQKRREPTGAAAVLLRIAEKHPEIVKESGREVNGRKP
jgi:putative transcriptional regulator